MQFDNRRNGEVKRRKAGKVDMANAIQYHQMHAHHN